MGRIQTVKSEVILDVTRRLVAARGLTVSTREIAAESGISEAVLYQRFSSKSKLIEAALGMPRVDWKSVIAAGVGSKVSRAALEGAVFAILAKFREVIPGILPVLGDPSTTLRSVLWAEDGPFVSCVRELEGYLDQEVKMGRLCAENPHATSFLIVSALHSGALFESLHGELRATDAAIHAVIGDLWNGLWPGN